MGPPQRGWYPSVAMVDSFEHNGHRYVREPVPLLFPSEAEVPETKRHLELRTALYLLWRRKLEKYRRLGVLELVRFTFDATPLLRVYDHVSGDLVEQKLSNPRSASSSVLGAFWVVIENPELGPMLRLARDADGKGLFPTPDEDRARLEEELRKRGSP